MIVSQAYTLKQALLVYVQHIFWLSNSHNACDSIGILSCRDIELEEKLNNTCMQVRFISIYSSKHYNADCEQWERWDFLVPHKSHTYSKCTDVASKVCTDVMLITYE